MIRSAVLRGINALSVDIEVGLSPPSPKPLVIVGLAKQAVGESYSRLWHAFRASGYEWPRDKITVNLAPADIWKEGTSLDLGIALAILEATGQVRNSDSKTMFAIGELGLEGRLRRCHGALSIGRMVPEDSVLIAPEHNRCELAVLRQMKGAQKQFWPYIARDLSEAARAVTGGSRRLAEAKKGEIEPAFHTGADFADVKGQDRAKRALEVAAAGGHNVLLIGPPGEGKSLLAKALPSILPNLRPQEALELTTIYSARGELRSKDSVVVYRPYRPVHHTASHTSIVGGGSGFPLPGEITLAHRGVLFMDELPEFPRRVLETLRQPLEDGEIHLTRKAGAATYPCEFILVAAMNPCPCGYDGESTCSRCRCRWVFGSRVCKECGSREKVNRCTCLPAQQKRYQERISGPIMDRIDLRVPVRSLTGEERFSRRSNESSRDVRKRVEAAREWQIRRFGSEHGLNARITAGKVDRLCELHPSALDAMKHVAERVPEMSTRGHDTLLKVSRTVADLNNSRQVYRKHIAEAADLCGHGRVHDLLVPEPDTTSCPGCGDDIEDGDRFCRHCGEAIA